MPNKRPIIGVMGSHEQEWEEFADPVGDLIARRGYHLLTGAGDGIMAVVARAFTHVKDRKGMSLGIVPTLRSDQSFVPYEGYPNPYIEIPIVTPLDKRALSDSMPYSRNVVNIMTSNALIILPGSHGTKNEVSLGLQYNKPMIMFGPDEAFAGFPEEPLRADNIKHVSQFLDDVFGAQEEE